MADLSRLGGLQPTEPLDLGDTYPVNRRTTFQLPTKGRYTLRAPESFPQEAFGTTKKGKLQIQIDPTIVGPTNEGFTVRRTKVSITPWERDGRKVSQIGDYLISTGYRGTINNDQEAADAVEATAGQTFEAELDWIAANYRTGFKLEGMNKFPRNPDGTYQSWVEDPTEKNPETGKPVRLLANLFVRNYIPAE